METTGIAAIKAMTIEAVIIRANGTIEPLGTIAYWHKNPFKRWMYRLQRAFTRKPHGGVLSPR